MGARWPARLAASHARPSCAPVPASRSISEWRRRRRSAAPDLFTVRALRSRAFGATPSRPAVVGLGLHSWYAQLAPSCSLARLLAPGDMCTSVGKRACLPTLSASATLPPSLAIARFLNISRSQSLVCHRMPPSHSHRELDARRSVVADRSRDLEISNPTWLDIFCAPRSFVRSFRFVSFRSSSAKMPHPSSRQPRSARFRRSLWFVCFVRRQRPLLDLDRFFISVTRPP